jgi:hypothetical protein
LIGHSIRKQRLAPLVCVIACVGICCSAIGLAKATAASEERSSAGRTSSFPLWKAVPTESFAVLGKGTVRQSEWGAYVFRQQGGTAGEIKPCIVVASFYYGWPAQDGGGFFQPGNPECGPLAPPAKQAVMDTSGMTIQRTPGGPTLGSTVMAMTVSLDVREVKLQLHPGPSLVLSTKLLSKAQAKKARVRPFRYVALSLARNVCVSGVTGLNAMGNQVLDSELRSCD